MHNASATTATTRYAKALETSRRIRWDIDKDVFRGRALDFSGHFLPEGLSLLDRLPFAPSPSAPRRRWSSRCSSPSW